LLTQNGIHVLVGVLTPEGVTQNRNTDG